MNRTLGWKFEVYELKRVQHVVCPFFLRCNNSVCILIIWIGPISVYGTVSIYGHGPGGVGVRGEGRG